MTFLRCEAFVCGLKLSRQTLFEIFFNISKCALLNNAVYKMISREFANMTKLYVMKMSLFRGWVVLKSLKTPLCK